MGGWGGDPRLDLDACTCTRNTYTHPEATCSQTHTRTHTRINPHVQGPRQQRRQQQTNDYPQPYQRLRPAHP